MECKQEVIQGDCTEVLKTLPENSVDAIVTDPPYGLSFMGKSWDYDVPKVEMWREALRVLKPGGYLLAFAGTRTQHRMAVNIEDAGFEIRDMIAWIYGSGFPKSLNIGKAVDKLQGNEREVVGESRARVINGGAGKTAAEPGSIIEYTQLKATKGTSEWEGWGTALKPALEPITVARKPLEGTVAENCLKWGVGGIAIDACRVVSPGHKSDDNNAYINPFHKDAQKTRKQNTDHQDESASSLLHQNDPLANDALCVQNLKSAQDYLYHCSICRHPCDAHLQNAKADDQEISPLLCDVHGLPFRPCEKHDNPIYQSKAYTYNINMDIKSKGRFPANLIHDGSDEVVSLFPDTKSVRSKRGGATNGNGKNIDYGDFNKIETYEAGFNDSGSAARFFMTCKYTPNDAIMKLCENNINANNAEWSLPITNLIEAVVNISSVLKSATPNIDLLNQNLNALFAERIPKNTVIDFVAKLAVMSEAPEGLVSQEELQVMQDYIINSRNFTPEQKLVNAVRGVNIDITQITINLLKLCGYVVLVIDENTNSDTKEKAEQKLEPKRFAYIPKASKSERNRGCEGLEEKKPPVFDFRPTLETNRENWATPIDETPYGRGGKMKNNHPTVKPIALMEYLIKLVSREGAVVLDPFMGSGSTLIACQNLKRNGIGIELDQEYIKIAEARLNRVKQNTLL